MPRLLPLTVSLLFLGCVTVYQPVAALQRPVTVDPSAKNFDGVRMLVRCVPSGDGADHGESEDLCNNMSALYTNQGAKVDVEIPDEEGGTVSRGSEGADAPAETPDLIIELRARRVHVDNSPFLWILFYASGTLIPAITEATFAQDVSIRDSDGFLLVADTFQARFIRYVGLAFWVVNGILDLVWRPKGEGLTGNNHKYDFSRDFHGQLSQLAFHATMRAKVLKGFEGEPAVLPAGGQVPAKPAPQLLQQQPAPPRPQPRGKQPQPQAPPPPVLPP